MNIHVSNGWDLIAAGVCFIACAFLPIHYESLGLGEGAIVGDSPEQLINKQMAGLVIPLTVQPSRSIQYGAGYDDAADDLAYRYLDDSEAAVIEKNGGVIPNVDRRGFPKHVSTTPNYYKSVQEAEEGLLLGRLNPAGPTNPPAYRATFERNSVTYTYAGNSQTGKGIEMITRQEIRILRLERLLDLKKLK